MKLASGVAPVTRMLALDLPVGLGPDGPAGSNNDFNMFEEMDLAAKLQKVTTMNPQALPAGQALEMATIRGARALGMEKEIGSLEAGKRADLITVRIDRAHAQPLYDAVSQMVYALKASDVRDVMVNGKPVVRDAKILTLDEKADSRQGGGVSRQGQRIAEVAGANFLSNRNSRIAAARWSAVPAPPRRALPGRARSCSGLP